MRKESVPFRTQCQRQDVKFAKDKQAIMRGSAERELVHQSQAVCSKSCPNRISIEFMVATESTEIAVNSEGAVVSVAIPHIQLQPALRRPVCGGAAKQQKRCRCIARVAGTTAVFQSLKSNSFSTTSAFQTSGHIRSKAALVPPAAIKV